MTLAGPESGLRHMTADLELLCLTPVLSGNPSLVQTLIPDFGVSVAFLPFAILSALLRKLPRVLLLLFLPPNCLGLAFVHEMPD